MKFYIHRLGCPKNDVDADYIAARLIADGHQSTDNPEDAQAILVNTCGFIEAAKQESIDGILTLAKLKNNGQRLYATGCLTQRYGDELLKEMPELDGAFGHGTLDQLAESVRDGKKLTTATRVDLRHLAYLDWKDRFIADDLPYSYLKISDGCNRPCTYCSIPKMRGSLRSRPVKSIVNEARFLASNGKKELILVSQESTLWGGDLPERLNIVDLLRDLEAVDGIEWIRLMYLYPSQVKPDLLDYMAGRNKTLPYFDLPMQHINDDVLKRMKRRGKRQATEDLLTQIRHRIPGATIRTTFIVGFPGESDAEFSELLDFVADQKFDRMGAFPYSAEEGTPAADMPDQVPEEIKSERMERLMMLQQEIAFEKNSTLIGDVVEVIIDAETEPGWVTGRTRGDCPDIDQEVHVPGNQRLAGKICRVRIESSEGYDLTGSLVTEPEV